MKNMHLPFADRMTYDAGQKTAVSIRDGVLEYLGVEIDPEGKELDPNRIYTVYRSPATIANAASKMAGIPITDDHVGLDLPPDDPQGEVIESEMFDAYDPETKTTIATRNKVSISDVLRASVESGKRELSLGYNAQLTEHPDYDFEQRDIIPHHLAVVQDGRCGSMCTFLDRKPQTQPPKHEENDMKIHAAFLDENGAINLQQIAEVVNSFPEMIKQMPLDQVQKLVPMLMESMEAVKSAGAEMPEDESDPTEDENGAGEKPGEKPDDMEAEDMEAEEDDEKKDFSDSQAFKDAVAAAVEEATGEAVKKHSEVIEKAKLFVDAEYSFSDKSTEQVMRDALATQSTETFSADELPLAFKLLKSSGDYKNFGDNRADKYSEIADKEL